MNNYHFYHFSRFYIVNLRLFKNLLIKLLHYYYYYIILNLLRAAQPVGGDGNQVLQV